MGFNSGFKGLTNLDKQTETQASVQNYKHVLQLKTSSTTNKHERQKNTRHEWKKKLSPTVGFLYQSRRCDLGRPK